jgi:cell division protein FtsN
MNKQRGGTLLGFVVGALVGLGAALAVAVYITKVPIPFMNKSAPRSAESEAAEAKKNRDWDPNAGLSGKSATKPVLTEKEASATASPAASSAAESPAAGTKPAPADPLGDLARTKAEAAGKVVATPVPATPASPAAPATASAGIDPFNYFVQVGAFRTPEDAEQQRIKLSLMGMQARVSEREQSGRLIYRVRLGPFEKKDDADKAKDKLDSSGLEAALVRVQK